MALSTNRTLITQTGINTHQVLNVGGLDSAGIATFLNFKTGESNVHSIGFDVVSNTGTGVTIRSTGNAAFSGIVTAQKFVGDISEATGAAAGLGTALSQTQTDPLNKIYYTNRVLSISTTTTIDHPATTNLAYTQYGDIKIEDGHDLIIKDGDDFKYDILGISTTKMPSNQFPAGLSGDLTGNVIGNLTGNVTGNVTGSVTGNLTGNVTGNVTGNLTGDVTGNTTGNVNTDKIIPTGGVPFGGGGGIIQVQQTVKRDAWSGGMSSNYPNFVEVTGLNVSITPKFASSKILITASVNFATSYWQGFGQLWRGIGGATRALLPSAVGEADGNRVRFTFTALQYNASGATYYNMYNGTVNHLDTPNTTAQVSYSIAMRSYDASHEVYVNRNHVDQDNSAYWGRGISSITVMEVSA
tara:strand:- start:641 stop:1876 length:1236 start_codon:yes stop_codon:yes gene_type:complete